jgi:hypothetical protein
MRGGDAQKGGLPMPKKPMTKAAPNDSTESHPNLQEEIRRLAYEIYEERGHEVGHELDDWLRAEAEITGTSVKEAA